jgi:hypothetical protein
MQNWIGWPQMARAGPACAPAALDEIRARGKLYRKLGTRPQVDGEVTLMVFPGKKAHHGP